MTAVQKLPSSPHKRGLHCLVRSLDPRRWDKYAWIVASLTVAGAFLRFYKLTESVMFMGDQGRDAIVVSRIFTNFDPVFIGPVTSVGNMYLGPLYYYFMLPFLRLSYPSPMGPVYAVAAAGTILIPLMYLLGSRMIGRRAAIFATVFLTFSSSAISLSRFSWNPNLMPLVGLVWIYCLYKATLGKSWYWVVVALTLAILLQLHYITLLAVGISGLLWLWSVYLDVRTGDWKKLVRPSGISLLIILLFQVPLVLFDMKHDWLNAQQFLKILGGDDAFASSQTGMSRVLQIFTQSRVRFTQLMVEITLELKATNSVWLGYAIMGGVVLFWIREKRRSVKQAIQLLLFSLLICVMGLSLYKNEVYLHYLAFLLPLVFLLFGYLFDRVMNIHKVLLSLIGAALLFFIWQNISMLSYAGGGPRLSVLQATADAIHSRVVPGEPYSIMLISESKDLYGMSYRYYLTTDAAKQPLDPEQFGTAKKMFVLWEDKSVAEPLKLPLYELLVFDVATPSASFDIPQGPTVLELRK